jgi:hypothetical protein
MAESVSPPPPRIRLCLGVTGHRDTNPEFIANRARIEQVLTGVLAQIDAEVTEARSADPAIANTRLYSLLADGTDQIAAAAALAHDWELIAPLPFGLALNVAINAHPQSPQDAEALLSARDCAGVSEPGVGDAARRMYQLADRALLFELADRDVELARLYLSHLRQPADRHLSAVFSSETSTRVALAGRVMIEQCDLFVAVWDGASGAQVGGTGHTLRAALEAGAQVLWIDARAPQELRLLQGLEALTVPPAPLGSGEEQAAALKAMVRLALRPRAGGHEFARDPLGSEPWPESSRPLWHAYRRIEALFGGLRWRDRFRNLTQTYETPDQVAGGSGAQILASAATLPGLDPAAASAIESGVMRRFAWADGVSAWRSDVYRGGMTANFVLAALAIVGGILYLPLGRTHGKWAFALFELLLLAFILWVTLVGQRHRWHGRWFETRRAAEYLRHAPIMMLLGVARAPGRWPQGTDTSWPEWYARNAIREAGLPRLKVTEAYLRAALEQLLLPQVSRQRDYHVAKAKRLATAHHNLDRLAERMFLLAILSVSGYLALKLGGVLHVWPKEWAEHSSLWFSFFGVLLPTFGGALAGLRYFGDFERFSAISRVTAQKLQVIHARITRLLDSPAGALDYGLVAELAHATDEVVVSEVESWQSVFGGKHVTVPV